MIEAQKFLRRSQRGENAVVKKRDARTKKQGLAKIVGNEDDGFAETAGERTEFALKLGASYRIESAKWLVHEKDGRVGGEGASDADALALATGEFAGAAVGEFGRVEADEVKQLLDARANAGGVPLFEGGDESDVLSDGVVRKKASVLDNISDSAA